MTLSNREALNFYMEGAKANLDYRVEPMNVSEIPSQLEIFYTYCYRQPDDHRDFVYFAIGKVKGT